DEIGTELEAAAARTIAERGVQLIGTAHGRTLENLLVNPTLSDLVGGIQSVTLGDEEAKRRGTQKTVLERKAPPTFDVLIEQLAYGEIIIHRDVAAAVDAMLRGHTVLAEQRTRDENDNVTKQMTQVATAERTDMRPELPARSGYGRGNGRQNGRAANGRGSRDDWKQRGLNDPRHMTDDGMVWQGMTQDMADDAEALMLAEPTGTTGSVSRVRQPARPRLRIYPFGVSRERLEESAKQMRINLDVTSNPAEADAVITSRTYFRRQQSQLPSDNVFVVETNTVGQMRKCLQRIVDLRDSENAVEARQHDHPTMLAIREAEDASIQLLNNGNGHVVLPPQNAYVRRMQHEIANRYNLESRSVGKDPYRRVQIMAR
ncbi:MAG TPA: R3H domain-containing nucleic acid-binding protein, partial [Ktedonobacterales bacterium]